jgi:hypothetical protein
MSPRPERRADEGENVVMTISAQALATRWQAQYASGDHSGIADTFKLGTGGSAGLRPYELLEAALASCMIISAAWNSLNRASTTREWAWLSRLSERKP